jgi:cytidine deaminase
MMTDSTQITTQWTDLVKQAIAARERAYAPYSHYRVGAALLTAGDQVYTGGNIENAAYSPTVCAERVVVFKAVSEGQRKFAAIAVATVNGVAPCGVCRQVLREFAPDLTIIITNLSGDYRVLSLSDLLPDSFGPEDLVTKP